MKPREFQKHIGEFAHTIRRVGDWQPGHQVIVWKQLTFNEDSLLEVESRGKKGSVHLSEIEFSGVFISKKQKKRASNAI
jgi:hypothetical protein